MRGTDDRPRRQRARRRLAAGVTAESTRAEVERAIAEYAAASVAAFADELGGTTASRRRSAPRWWRSRRPSFISRLARASFAYTRICSIDRRPPDGSSCLPCCAGYQLCIADPVTLPCIRNEIVAIV
jgi:hypothetical protein